METVAHIDKADDFFRGRGIHPAAEKTGIVYHHTDRMPIQPGQHGNHRTALILSDLENRAPIKDEVQYPSGIVWLPPVSGYDGKQFFFPSPGIIITHGSGGRFIHIWRHVGQETPDLAKCTRFTLGFVVHDAAPAGVYFISAQLFLGHHFGGSRSNQGGTRGEYLAGLFYHNGKVGADHPKRTQSRHRTHSHGHHRDHAQQVGKVPCRVTRNFGCACFLQQLYTAPGGVHETHKGQTHFQRQRLGPYPLVGNGGFRGASPDREILGRDHRPPAVNPALPDNHICRGKIDDIAV